MPDLHKPFREEEFPEGLDEKTLAQLQEEHAGPPRSRHRLPRGEMAEQRSLRNYVRDLVLGFNDGLVSTYAATAGVAGAFAGAAVVAGGTQVGVVGVAVAVAGALSMALGEYISTKSQQEYYEAEAAREREHIRKWPELEAVEVREALERKGLSGKTLDAATKAIASDDEKLLDFMMREEFGLGEEAERSPWAAAGLILVAFLVGAVIPVVPYFVTPATQGLWWSSGVSAIGLFVAGAVRARASDLNPWKRGFEMLIIGYLAAGTTFLIGRLIGVSVA